MANEFTKKQLREFFDKAIQKAQNPDPKEKNRRKREQRAKKVEKQYGF